MGLVADFRRRLASVRGVRSPFVGEAAAGYSGAVPATMKQRLGAPERSPAATEQRPIRMKEPLTAPERPASRTERRLARTE